jgi:hypothetical protein
MGGSARAPARGFRGNDLKNLFFPRFSCCLDFRVHCWAVFNTWFLLMVFYFRLRNYGC